MDQVQRKNVVALKMLALLFFISCRVSPILTYYLQYLLIAFEPVALCHTVGHHDAERPTDNVAERDGNEILGEHLRDGDIGTPEHAEGQQEHVGDRVVESERDKGHDGEPDGGCR